VRIFLADPAGRVSLQGPSVLLHFVAVLKIIAIIEWKFPKLAISKILFSDFLALINNEINLTV